MKIVIGAGKTAFDGWRSTNEDELNALERGGFEKLLGGERAEAMLAEHVWEHMTLEDGIRAAKNCYDFIRPGGYMRAAVPDANFRSEWYQNMVKPGGNGDPDHPSYTHKIVYDAESFARVFREAGFEVELLEYCDAQGGFHYKYWNPDDGYVGRSLRYDTRNAGGRLVMVSIIIDAKKPLVTGADGIFPQNAVKVRRDLR